MKTAAVIWNIGLLGGALYGGFVRWGPMAYEQAHYQFTDPRGDSSMWPVTFQMLLFLISFVACAIALSYLFNRPLGRFARVTAGGLAVVLFAGWVVYGVLLCHDDLPGFLPTCIPGQMLAFDGSAFLITAAVSFIIAAATGRGPISVLTDRLSNIRKKAKPPSQT